MPLAMPALNAAAATLLPDSVPTPSGVGSASVTAFAKFGVVPALPS